MYKKLKIKKKIRAKKILIRFYNIKAYYIFVKLLELN